VVDSALFFGKHALSSNSMSAESINLRGSPALAQFSRFRPPPDALLLEGIQGHALAKALSECDKMKTEVRLSCRFAHHWFSSKRIVETGWVDQCACAEERLTATQVAVDSATSIIDSTSGYSTDCGNSVRAACAVPVLNIHRTCSSNVLFGELEDDSWSTRIEGAAVLLGLLSEVQKGSASLVAFAIHLLAERISKWVPNSALCQGINLFPEKIPQPSLLGIATALQWLASARESIVNRVVEDDYGFDGIATETAVTATCPDFSVLFCARLHVWVVEVDICLRALAVIADWWPNALRSPDASDYNLSECAQKHRSLLRTAYARSLAIRRSWQYGRTAIGFSEINGEVDADE
jgi:hypothetical protein